jgi:hypothetical protein
MPSATPCPSTGKTTTNVSPRARSGWRGAQGCGAQEPGRGWEGGGGTLDISGKSPAQSFPPPPTMGMLALGLPWQPTISPLLPAGRNISGSDLLFQLELGEGVIDDSPPFLGLPFFLFCYVLVKGQDWCPGSLWYHPCSSHAMTAEWWGRGTVSYPFLGGTGQRPQV